MPIEWVPLSEEMEKWIASKITKSKNPRKTDWNHPFFVEQARYWTEANRKCPIPEWLLNRELPPGTPPCRRPGDGQD